MNVSYSGYVGLSNPTYKLEYVNSTQYAELYNEALYNLQILKAGNTKATLKKKLVISRDGSKTRFISKHRLE
ncbi:hypothetical protein NXX18_20570 [Bacteroides fragilis]|nr:hypothetical protein [Bacteroides fragilis]